MCLLIRKLNFQKYDDLYTIHVLSKQPMAFIFPETVELLMAYLGKNSYYLTSAAIV